MKRRFGIPAIVLLAMKFVLLFVIFSSFEIHKKHHTKQKAAMPNDITAFYIVYERVREISLSSCC